MYKVLFYNTDDPYWFLVYIRSKGPTSAKLIISYIFDEKNIYKNGTCRWNQKFLVYFTRWRWRISKHIKVQEQPYRKIMWYIPIILVPNFFLLTLLNSVNKWYYYKYEKSKKKEVTHYHLSIYLCLIQNLVRTLSKPQPPKQLQIVYQKNM